MKTGLDYNGVASFMMLQGTSNRKDLFEKIRIMESELLLAERERRISGKEN